MPVCVSFQTVDIVESRCGEQRDVIGQSDWFSCFKKVNNGCPHGFIKIKTQESMFGSPCGSTGVCCLIVPRIQIEVNTIVMIRTDNYTLMMA